MLELSEHETASAEHDQPAPAEPRPSRQSLIGLNAANFFLAEITGVVMPFLAKYLAQHEWRDDAIGAAVAIAGLGVCVMQTPAGLIVDWVHKRRLLLAGASLVLGIAYGILPLFPDQWWVVDGLLFVSGASQAFFIPLVGALALGLVGHAGFQRTMGVNQAWNHAGNIAAAVLAMVLVAWLSTASIFFAVLVVSVIAATSTFLIRPDELKHDQETNQDKGGEHSASFLAILRDRRILILLLATALFHLANAPVMPLVGLYIARLGGTDQQVAAVVLVAQVVMVPVALLAGWLCTRWGRKPVYAIGLVVLPVRIFLYSLTTDPWMLVALQTLDGIGAGIYGVVIAVICADLTRGTGRFNGLQGLVATALSIGGVIGPLAAGLLVQHLGFAEAFYAFAAIAAVAAVVFIAFMPETAPADGSRVSPDEPVGHAQAKP